MKKKHLAVLIILLMTIQQSSIFAQAEKVDTLPSNQFFIQMFPDSQHVKCGRYLELDTLQITKIYFTKVDSSLFWTIDEALNLLFARQHGHPLYYIHGFYASTPNLTQRTVLAFKKYYLQDTINQTTDIIHLVWDSNKLSYKKSQQVIKKSRESLAMILQQAAQKSQTKAINLLCHSMGNQFLMETVKAGYLTEKVINTLILAAPDMDMADFVVYQKGIDFIAQKVLVFYNKKDKILAAARIQNKERRLGQRLPNTTISDTFTFLDCSKMKINHSIIAKLNRHTYFLASDKARNLMHLFLQDNLSVAHEIETKTP